MTLTRKRIDEDLVERLRNNDEEALSIIYKEYWEIMYLSAYNLLKNRAVSEDVVQEVFFSFWQKRSTLEIKVSIRSYLYTSVTYKVYDYFRKNKKMIKEELFQHFDEKVQALTPETKLIHKELVDYIDSLITQLPPKRLEVFKLSREEQLSNQEIAKRLGISKRTVEGHITKALIFLRSSLGVHISIEFLSLISNP
ncbi:RNA polymerase sigma factor [Flavivirga spongiicola]|uniref:RNA polymerase sigma-70 factor n=1 Tax=Flavivirga spongiicola TaxID=421621 RepID=A0ABU7XWM8_9FLAO|nr:RNA polymerase sigma-70 factor [Flavivirga sp. MEBiC05379]MDO5980183.1 RNA polymerase sigma-70 factor [Flavivirga sp. MEBiC05379]